MEKTEIDDIVEIPHCQACPLLACMRNNAATDVIPSSFPTLAFFCASCTLASRLLPWDGERGAEGTERDTLAACLFEPQVVLTASEVWDTLGDSNRGL